MKECSNFEFIFMCIICGISMAFIIIASNAYGITLFLVIASLVISCDLPILTKLVIILGSSTLILLYDTVHLSIKYNKLDKNMIELTKNKSKYKSYVLNNYRRLRTRKSQIILNNIQRKQ